MKVYKVSLATNDFMRLLPSEDFDASNGVFPLVGTTKQDVWPAGVKAIAMNEDRLRPDLISFGANNIAFFRSAKANLRSLLPSSAELLPFTWGSEVGDVVNLIGAFDCLDEEKSEWDEFKGKRIRLRNIVFNKKRVPDDILFKVRGAEAQIFSPDHENESKCFKAFCESSKVSGLRFEEVFSD